VVFQWASRIGFLQAATYQFPPVKRSADIPVGEKITVLYLRSELAIHSVVSLLIERASDFFLLYSVGSAPSPFKPYHLRVASSIQ